MTSLPFIPNTAWLGRLVASFLPDGVVHELRRLRSLEPGARATYLSRLVQRLRSTPTETSLPGLNGECRVLFVCHGNIMRSALAEAIVRQELRRSGNKTVTVRSAGLHAIVDSPADPRMVRAAGDIGVVLDEHRATLISESLLAKSDVVFVMDYLNDAEIRARYPAHAAKFRLLGAAVPSSCDGIEIPDPFSESEAAVYRCVERVRDAVCALLRE